MRVWKIVVMGLVAMRLEAQESMPYQPIFTQPRVLRTLQSTLDSVTPRLGPYGLTQPAAARFGWDRIQQDSGFAYDAARTLWLDYYCLFGDSACADWAMVQSPRAVRNQRAPNVRWNEWIDRPGTKEQGTAVYPYQRAPWAPTNEPISASPANAQLLNTPPAKPSVLHIVVRTGDNFGVLQRRHPGVTLKELYAANKGTDRIYPGQVLEIPR